MSETGRSGHVSRHRLLGEGSAFVRQLARAQEAQAQHAAHTPVQAAHEQDAVPEEPPEPAILNFHELWDARAVASNASAYASDNTATVLETHCWWPHQPDPAASKAVQAAGGMRNKATQQQALQHSAALGQLLVSHQSKARQKAAAARARDRRAEQLAKGRQLTARLLGSPEAIVQQLRQQNSNINAVVARSSTVALDDWICCNKPYPSEPIEPTQLTETVSSVGVCGCANPASTTRCQGCGSARWDGAAGQLRQRLLAVMQTADLGSTGVKQVAARLAAESGSHPALGLQLQPEDVNDAVHAFLAARREAAESSTAGAGSSAAGNPAPAGTAVPSAQGGAVLAGSDSPAVVAVFDRLKACRSACLSKEQQQQQQSVQQQQRQQQSQLRQGGRPGRLALSSAAPAAVAPEVLLGVFREVHEVEQDRDLIPMKPAQKWPLPAPPIHVWMADVLEQAAAATPAQHGTAQNGGSANQVPSAALQPSVRGTMQRVSAQRPTPISQALPGAIVQQLLDRKTAALRQEVLNYAQQLKLDGSLPVVKRTTCLVNEDGSPDEETALLTECLPVWEWLWLCTLGNSVYKGGDLSRPSTVVTKAVYLTQDRVLRDRLPDGTGPNSSREAVDVAYVITSDDWTAVARVRRRLQHTLTAWQQVLVPDWAPDPTALGTFKLDYQLQCALIAQRQQLHKLWGTAARFKLRQALARWSTQRHQQETQGQASAGGQRAELEQQTGTCTSTRSAPAAARQQRTQPTAAQHAEPARKNRRQSGKRARQPQPQDEAASLQQTQSVEQPPTKRVTRAAAAAATGTVSRSTSCGPTSSSSSDSGTNSDTGLASSNGTTTDNNQPGQLPHERQQRRRHRKRARVVDSLSIGHTAAAGDSQCEADFDEFLASLDDLLAPDTAYTGHDFTVRPGSVWRAATTAPRAADSEILGAGGSDVVGAAVADGPTLAGGLSPGVRAVLSQATAMGVSRAVLQRTIHRLQDMVTRK